MARPGGHAAVKIEASQSMAQRQGRRRWLRPIVGKLSGCQCCQPDRRYSAGRPRGGIVTAADRCALRARSIQTHGVRWSERWPVAVLGSSLWLLPGPLAARDAFEVSWRAPAECPSHAEASAALSRLAAAGSELAAAHVEIERTKDGWQATLSTPGAQRRLQGESCGAVVQAVTVVLALAADQAATAATAPAVESRPPAATPETPPADGREPGMPLH